GETGEISGHYHPKVRLSGRSRPCLLVDADRAILPAYGTYTGGLRTDAAALSALMGAGALAVMTGPTPCALPMPR
ncbi:MAG: metallophosphoesterase, partial [Maritimibacter sp.]|nr:metallophosphoesterase [Maritimibacter sp.]